MSHGCSDQPTPISVRKLLKHLKIYCLRSFWQQRLCQIAKLSFLWRAKCISVTYARVTDRDFYQCNLCIYIYMSACRSKISMFCIRQQKKCIYMLHCYTIGRRFNLKPAKTQSMPNAWCQTIVLTFYIRSITLRFKARVNGMHQPSWGNPEQFLKDFFTTADVPLTHTLNRG